MAIKIHTKTNNQLVADNYSRRADGWVTASSENCTYVIPVDSIDFIVISTEKEETSNGQN